MLGRMAGWIECASSFQARDPSNALEDFVIPEGNRILEDVAALLAEGKSFLPPAAVVEADRLLEMRGKVHGRSGVPGVTRLRGAIAMFHGAFQYHTADPETAWVGVVERAFLHLNRLLVVDTYVRETWRDALEAGETRAEALGGAHLLLHGLWAFKTNASGERCDLVLGDRLADRDADAHPGVALVLTEWKVAARAEDVPDLARQARRQAEMYGAGSLAGFELRSVRYVVTVGLGRAELLAAESVGGVVYRHKHVAVDPASPSVESRRRR
jgi:hypothetical protein